MKSIKGGEYPECWETCCFDDGGSNPIIWYVTSNDCDENKGDADCSYHYGPSVYRYGCVCG